jgi:hypothetical protein
MITVNDILTQWQTFKGRINEFYTLIQNEVNADVNLNDLDLTLKTEDHNLWMYISAAISAIMDGVWEDRKKEIQDKVDSFIPLPDRWLQSECFTFQYGDPLLWNAQLKKYYYAVLDPAKQIIKRCAIIRSGGTTFVKVATLSGATPVALSAPQLTAFAAFVDKIQPAGGRIATPNSFNSDKLKALMTVYYDATKPVDDVKAIVEPAYDDYLANLDFNGEYSINRHGDFVEKADTDIIREVIMGVVEAKTDAGSYAAVNRVYTPNAGYIIKDPAIDYNDLITYVPV